MILLFTVIYLGPLLFHLAFLRPIKRRKTETEPSIATGLFV